MRRFAVTVALALISASPPAERVVTGDGVTTMTVNGMSTQVRADPAAPGVPLVTQAFADRAGLKINRKLGIGFVFAVGPTRVVANTRGARTTFGGKPAKQRVGWSAWRFTSLAEGSVGPAGLPEPVIRFVLRPPVAGERTWSLPIEEIGFPLSLFGGAWLPTFAIVEIDGAPLRVRLDPYHARSLATAGAAARIAQAYGGALSGDTVPTEIFFGIDRPVRRMTLARPMPVGGLTLSTLGVRIADAGGVAAIPEAGAVAPTPDPAEVVVIGRGKKRDTRHDVLSLGADALARCSAIVFDKPAKQIRLTCG